MRDGAHLAVLGLVLLAAVTVAAETSWIEIAAHLGSWRTDLVVRNAGSSEAEVVVRMHTADGIQELTGTVGAGEQLALEDVVGLMDHEGKGALEIRSDQPLSASARIYSWSTAGTLGQHFRAHTAEDALVTGDFAWLEGLRQVEGAFRTNISVTNIGAEPASVQITLLRGDGTPLVTYTSEDLAPGSVWQDLQPLRDRASEPDLGWAMAKVEVLSGSGVLTSASVVDSMTEDPTTISMVKASEGGGFVRGLVPTDDVYVASLEPDSNFDRGALSIVAQGPACTVTEISLLKFDLSDVAEAADASARLQLEGRFTFGDGEIALHEVADDSWAETEVVWTTRPDVGPRLAVVPNPGGGPMTVVFTGAALAEYINRESASTGGSDPSSGDDTISFAVHLTDCTQGYSSVQCDDKEIGGVPPQLDLGGPRETWR